MFIVLPAYGAASYVPAIVLERTLYTRERSDGLYLPITYLLAKMVDELLCATIASVGLAAATFFAIGFQGSFGLFWLIYVLVLYIGVVLAYWIAAISPNMDVANALLPVYVTIQLFFGGFILDFRTMPSYWKWYSYLDFMRYAWGGLMVNQFSGPKGDPEWINGQTVLEFYQLKSYEDRSSAHYTWYTPDVVRDCVRA
jgi:ABC-type multidrug transport system permease subunit